MTKGMLPYENQIADYIKRTQHHVLYRVTPYFVGNDLVAGGVWRTIGKMRMKDNVLELVRLGKIPNDSEMSDEEFRHYDKLLQMEEALTLEEAELLITLFSDDCDDLNWGLLHAIENVAMQDLEKYRDLISRCNNQEFAKIFEMRLTNSIGQEKI